MKKKILFILPGFNFGGTVFSTLNMISFLKRDYDVTVLPMTYQGPVIQNYKEASINLLPESLPLCAMMGRIDREHSTIRKCSLYCLKLIRKMLSFISVDFEQFIYRYEAKKIESHYHFDFVASCQEGGATYFASCFRNCKRYGWFRSEYSVYKTENRPEILEKDQHIYPFLDKIVCVSKTTRNDFISFFPQINEKVLPIHNIQNIDNINHKSLEAVTDFPDSDFVIVSVGRINPQKRFSAIPQIARKLLDSGCDFKWIILGDGNAFGEWGKLQDEINKYNVKDIVLCLGSKLNPYPYIRRSQLLVNTSYVEACPRVVIEAKILKTPVICADFSSAREFVTNDEDGYVDKIEKLHQPISEMILNKQLYMCIKNTCESFHLDNEQIYNQLKKLFS